MPSAKPKQNSISSHKDFGNLCHDTRKTYKMWITSSQKLSTSSSHRSPSVASARIGLNDITEWLVPLAAADAPSDKEEWHAEEYLHGTTSGRFSIRKRTNRTAYNLTNSKPTWEPRENLNQTVIAKFNKERRCLVRKTYIKYEDVEGNTLTKTEG
ncbi:Hypothetical protein PHPALM_17953 [Phytophthora palmivora]|uniref:Uncharacterized protein n=1 Tax=Phytophthora palmivora TaxID=4796 RepID=A0A2P4XKY1_9STRA|nr:Hypothetical protein PHPALM_17953 [Phytophthora palmivora]